MTIDEHGTPSEQATQHLWKQKKTPGGRCICSEQRLQRLPRNRQTQSQTAEMMDRHVGTIQRTDTLRQTEAADIQAARQIDVNRQTAYLHLSASAPASISLFTSLISGGACEPVLWPAASSW